jgi:hypothetical protein
LSKALIVRGVVAATALFLAAPSWAATAAPQRTVKPVCHLVTDPAGDATGTGTPVTAPNDPDLDIVGADIATNSSTLTAVVRLAAVAPSDSTAPTGMEYQVVFAVGTTTMAVDAVIAPNGTSWAAGKGKGVVNAAKKEIHISVPLSTLPKITGIGARTYRAVANDQILLGNVDKADGASTYLAGQPSCVKVGA